MERRYLVATLALVATFAIFSQGFSLGHLAKLPRSRAEVRADLTCAKHYVAAQLMAKLQPYLDQRAPEQAQMVAELNLPELTRVDEKTPDGPVAPQAPHQRCPAAARAQQARQQAFDMRINTGDHSIELNDLAIIRAEDLSERAQEWGKLAADRAQQIDMHVILRAQETAARNIELAQQTAARNLERAQREIERSRSRMAHSQMQGMPIHINFVVPVKANVVVPIPPAPPSF